MSQHVESWPELAAKGAARAPGGLAIRLSTLLDRCPLALPILLARLSVAAVFWRAGRSKVEGLSIKPETFYLFEHEYRVPVIPPELAAYLATAAEHLFPVLLVIGLAGRIGAGALMAMTSVIQILVYPDAWPTHFLWFSLLFLILARGPGTLSLDFLIRRSWQGRGRNRRA